MRLANIERWRFLKEDSHTNTEGVSSKSVTKGRNMQLYVISGPLVWLQDVCESEEDLPFV